MKYDIFISYRRDGGEMTARIIRDRLTELGYSIFFDVETLRNGDFNTALYEQIDNCKDFLLILSPNALDRCTNEGDWVRREVEYALMKGKNIVPVMLRGFSFPDTLPPSLQALPYKNGIEANSQFFDAFIEKLRVFLLTKPTLIQQIKQSSLLRKALPLLLALTVLLGAVFGGGAIWNFINATYPRTIAQINLTEECIYYIGQNLTYFNIFADAKENAMDAAVRYLQTGEQTELDHIFDASLHTIENTDISTAAPSEGFLTELKADSPFPAVEFTAMYNTLKIFQQGCREDLQYIRQLISPEFLLSDSQKLESIDYYLKILENELLSVAYATNQMLLCVTNEKPLEILWEDILTELEHIPLNKARWVTDKESLEQAIRECLNNEENAIHGLESILGNSTIQAGQEREALIKAYEAKGYSRSDAEKMVELVLEGYHDGQPEYIVIFTAMGYTREQALDIWTYTQQGYTADTAQKLVDYEILDLETEKARITAQLTAQGYIQTDAESYAAQLLELEEMKHTLRLKFCGLTTDDPDTLWAKMIKMKDAMQYEEAVECLELFQLASEDNPDQVKGAASAILLLQDMETGGIDHGIVVMGYGEQAHPVLLAGDIIIAFNGEACVTSEDYVNRKAALPGTNYTVTILRPENGALTQLDVDMTTEMPPIAIYALDTP